MRIATWNVNGLRARLDFVRHWLAARRPDVVGLQELKSSDENFPHAALLEAGYRAVVHGQKSWNGVAVLTRSEAGPVTRVQSGLPGQEDFGARLLTVDVAGLRFTTLYCPNGKHTGHADYARKLAWFDALGAHLAKPARGAAIVCGDFNIVPGALDTWDEAAHEGAIFHTPAERARLQTLFGAGWLDLFRALHPAERAFSWWDYRGGAFHRGHGLRIDFLLGAKTLLPRLRAVVIDRDYRKKKEGLTPSDHAPVFADLD